MQFLLRALALMFCLLFTRSAQGQDLGHSVQFVTDTEETHFEDYWRRVNNAALTEDGRNRLDSGQTRLSLRAMSNPLRYGLIAPQYATEVLTAADLLCDNRATGSLQLRCRMPGEPHSRRVRLTDATCAGHPDLFTLIPDGCEHPYVMTIEGRDVTLNQLTPLTTPPETVAATTSSESVVVDRLSGQVIEQQAEIQRLQQQARDLVAERTELQREQRAVNRHLERVYVALLILLVLAISAVGIALHQRKKLRTGDERERGLATQVRTLSETSVQFSRSTLEATAVQQRLAAYNTGLHAEASSVIGQLMARTRSLEERLAEHEKRPSVIIDQSAFHAEEIAAEAEERARKSEQDLRHAQDIERQRLQNRLDEQQRHIEELRRHAEQERQMARERSETLEQREHTAIKDRRDLEERLRVTQERLENATSSNIRLAKQRAGIDDENRRLRLANHTLKQQLMSARDYIEGLATDVPDFLLMPSSDPLFIPTPPSTRAAPPPSDPPLYSLRDVTTAVVGQPPMYSPGGPPGAMTTGRQTLTGIGDDPPEQGSARDTLRLTVQAGSPSPPLTPENAHRAPTTPPPPNYFHVDTARTSSDSWEIPPTPSEPRTDDAHGDRHPSLAMDTGDQTGLWMLSATDDGSDVTVNLVPVPQPDPLPSTEEKPAPSSPDTLHAHERTDPQLLSASIFHIPTRETSIVSSEQLIARGNELPDS